MSEKDKIDGTELKYHIQNNINRIKELEKKHEVSKDKINDVEMMTKHSHPSFKKRIKELETHWRVWMNSDKDAHDKIEELEKKGEIRGSGMNQLTKAYKEHTKEIAELKANFDDHTHLVWFNKIKELEEEDEHIKHIMNVNRTGVSNLFTKYGEIKEVLREFIRWHNDSLFFEGLLAKLSGEDNKTEKKELIGIKHDPEYINQFTIYKPSGGEKEVRVRHSEFDERNVPSDDLSTHSKPPEYNPNCERCTSLLCGDCIEKPPEPREDDSPERIKQIKAMDRQMMVEVGTHILVKREDLQFLYEYSYPEGVFDDDLIDEFYIEKKRIKEEYSL